MECPKCGAGEATVKKNKFQCGSTKDLFSMSFQPEKAFICRRTIKCRDRAYNQLEAVLAEANALLDEVGEGIAEILDFVNDSKGVVGVNATENDTWEEIREGGMLKKFDRACELLHERYERKGGG